MPRNSLKAVEGSRTESMFNGSRHPTLAVQFIRNIITEVTAPDALTPMSGKMTVRMLNRRTSEVSITWELISAYKIYSKIDNVKGDDGAGESEQGTNTIYWQGLYVYFPNLICASANSSRPRRKLTSLNGSGSREEPPVQGQGIGEYSLQSLHKVV